MTIKEKLTIFLFATITAGLPLFFLPFTVDTHEYNKLVFLVIADCLLLLTCAWQLVTEKALYRHRQWADYPLILLAVSVILSTLLQSPNPFLSFTTPLSTAAILGSILLYILITAQYSSSTNRVLHWSWIVAAIITAGYTMAMDGGYVGFSIYTPAGNLLDSALFLGVTAAYLLFVVTGQIIKKDRETIGKGHMILHVIALIVCSTGTYLLGKHLLTDHRPIILPPAVGFTVAQGIFGNIRSALLGVGPTNFLSAFTMQKTLEFNRTAIWNISFTSSSSFFLTLLTEMGILAAVAYLWLFFLTIIRSVEQFSPSRGALILLLLVQISLPGSMTLLVLTIILLILSGKKEADRMHQAPLASWVAWSSGVLILLFVLAVAALVNRAYQAEVFYARSLAALQQTKGKDAYDLQVAAIGANPFLDRYYLAFSQTNLLLAKAIAGKTQPTAEENAILPVLIRQAIDNGHAAISRAPTNPGSWTNLGRIYADLLSFAQDSDHWALESYQQAQRLDPRNPLILLSIADIYQKDKKYIEEEQVLKQAMELKPDLAATFWFRAQLRLAQNQPAQARSDVQMARQLTPPNTPEADSLLQELQAIPQQK